MNDRSRVFDPGLQAERTALAWDRTGLSFGLAGALLVRAGTLGAPTGQVVGAAALTFGALLLIAGHTRYLQRDRSLREHGIAPGHPLLLATGVAAVLVSLTALGVALALTVG